MDVRSDDFSGLLAALGKAPAPIQPNPQFYQQFAPQMQPQYMYPAPQTFPQQYQYAPTPEAPKVAPSNNNWIIIILLLAVLVFGLLAWMRSTRMQEPEDRALARELPPPSAVTSSYEEWPQKWPEPDDVANNILKFVEEHAPEKPSPKKTAAVIDLSGVDLPTSTTTRTTAGRLSADESQTVLDYAKRRESLLPKPEHSS